MTKKRKKRSSQILASKIDGKFSGHFLTKKRNFCRLSFWIFGHD